MEVLKLFGLILAIFVVFFVGYGIIRLIVYGLRKMTDEFSDEQIDNHGN